MDGLISFGPQQTENIIDEEEYTKIYGEKELIRFFLFKKEKFKKYRMAHKTQPKVFESINTSILK